MKGETDPKRKFIFPCRIIGTRIFIVTLALQIWILSSVNEHWDEIIIQSHKNLPTSYI